MNLLYCYFSSWFFSVPKGIKCVGNCEGGKEGASGRGKRKRSNGNVCVWGKQLSFIMACQNERLTGHYYYYCGIWRHCYFYNV